MDEQAREKAALNAAENLDPAQPQKVGETAPVNAEQRTFDGSLSDAMAALGGAVPPVRPPPGLREKILARCTADSKTVALPRQTISWLPWALAACLAAVCGILLVVLQARSERITALNDMTERLQSATNDLQQTVQTLKKENRLKDLRIALLNSLVSDRPKTMAVTLWDDRGQNGVFVAENLQELPADKDYELWVLDGGKVPVPAGVFRGDTNGKARLEFKPVKNVAVAGVFAVTMENKGGVDAPTVKNMILAGN